MAYQCPRCGGVVRRGASRGAMAAGGLAAGCIGGLLAWVLSFVFGSMSCERCGPIPKKEFPPQVRSEMFVGSLTIVSVGAVALVGLVYFLSQLRH
jgi:hypothetical protein